MIWIIKQTCAIILSYIFKNSFIIGSNYYSFTAPPLFSLMKRYMKHRKIDFFESPHPRHFDCTPTTTQLMTSERTNITNPKTMIQKKNYSLKLHSAPLRFLLVLIVLSLIFFLIRCTVVKLLVGKILCYKIHSKWKINKWNMKALLKFMLNWSSVSNRICYYPSLLKRTETTTKPETMPLQLERSIAKTLQHHKVNFTREALKNWLIKLSNLYLIKKRLHINRWPKN